MCFLLILWALALVVLFALAAAAWHNQRRWVRYVLGPLFSFLFLAGTLAHPIVNFIVFSEVFDAAHAQRELARVESQILVGEPADRVTAALGEPRRAVDSEDRQRWYYNCAPWYAYGGLNDIVVEFENDEVIKVYIDWF